MNPYIKEVDGGFEVRHVWFETLKEAEIAADVLYKHNSFLIASLCKHVTSQGKRFNVVYR